MKLSQNHPGRVTVIEVEKKRDQRKEHRERITAENIQLKALNKEAVQHMSENETNCINSQKLTRGIEQLKLMFIVLEM